MQELTRGWRRFLLLSAVVVIGLVALAALEIFRPVPTLATYRYAGEWGPSPRIIDGDEKLLLISSTDGAVSAFSLTSGERRWIAHLPTPRSNKAWVMADPGVAGDRLVYVYSVTPPGGTRTWRAAVINWLNGK